MLMFIYLTWKELSLPILLLQGTTPAPQSSRSFSSYCGELRK